MINVHPQADPEARAISSVPADYGRASAEPCYSHLPPVQGSQVHCCCVAERFFHSMHVLYNVHISRTWGVENGIGAALVSGFDGLAVLASTISTSAVEMVKQHKLVNILACSSSNQA